MAVVLLPAGCDSELSESQASRQAQEQIAELSQQLESERRNTARERRRTETVRVQGEQDFQALGLILVTAGITIVGLVLLLARERRARRVLERLLRLILDRVADSHSPPR
jgi:hypothetical protein